MTATGTGGVGMGMGEQMLPEMPEDDLPPMDGGDESELGLDDGMDMGDDLGGDDLGDMGEGETVSLDALRRVLDDCCPDKAEMVMDAVQAELGGGMDDMGDDLGGDLGGDDMMDGMDDMGDVGGVEECMMPEGEDDMPTMESKVAEIAGLITEDPDIFTRPARRRR